MAEDLVQIMNEKNIKLSIISPRKIPALQKMFEMNKPDPSELGNLYAKDLSHMVLLNGISIPKRPLDPRSSAENCKLPLSRSQQMAMAIPVESVCDSIIKPQLETHNTHMNDVKEVQQTQHLIEQGTSSGVQFTQPPAVPSIHPPIATPVQVMKTLPFSQMPLPPVYSRVDQRLPQQLQHHHPQQQISQHLQQAQQQQIWQEQQPTINLLNVGVTNPESTLAAAAQHQQQRIIWTGTLVWLDKVKELPNKITRMLQCRMLINPEETEINLSKWPDKVPMVMLPPSISQSLRQLFKDAKIVTFLLNQNQDSEAINVFHKSLINKICWCIYFNSKETGSPNDIRVIILLYNNRKQLLGVIPKDQANFLQILKQKFKPEMESNLAQGEMTNQQNSQQMQQQNQQLMTEQSQQILTIQQQQMKRTPMYQMRQLQTQNNQQLKYLLLNQPRPQNLMVRPMGAGNASAQGVAINHQSVSIQQQQRLQSSSNQNFIIDNDLQELEMRYHSNQNQS